MAAVSKCGHRNIAVVVGVLTRDPEVRELPDGQVIVELDVKVAEAAKGSSVVPVSWSGGKATFGAGDVVVVVGRVRRRFWNAGGGPMSRTDVLAEIVVPGGSAKRTSAALAEAAARVSL